MKRKKLVLTLAVLAITFILATPIVMSYLVGNSNETGPTEFLETSGSSLVDGSSWTTTQLVSTESTNAAHNPSLAVGLDGTAHVAWYDYTTLPPDAEASYDIFYKKYVPGTGWTTTQVVSTESTSNAYNPSLAIDLDGTVHMSWHDHTTLPPDADAYSDIFYKTYVPGTGWTTTQLVSTESTKTAECPSLAVGSDGTVHVAWHDLTTYDGDSDSNADIFYKTYVPGTGWTITQVVSTESTEDAAYPSLAVDPDGTVHVAWTDVTDYGGDSDGLLDVFYKKYVPGIGWTVTQVVSTESTDWAGYPSLAVGPDGTVHAAWIDMTNYGGDSDGLADIFYKKCVLGAGWTITQVVSTESTEDAAYPRLAVGPDGTVHVAWTDWTNYDGDSDAYADTPDVFYKKYVLGTGWTTTQLVSTESTHTAQYPSLAVGPDGTVHAAWEDGTALPPDADAYTDIFYKKNVLSPIEPTSLSDLITPPALTHLRDLYGTQKTSKYAYIKTLEGYAPILALLGSKGYTFAGDYNISIVEGTINGNPFSGALYSHWLSLNLTTGTRALLAAATMDDGVDIMFGVVTNLLPPQLRPPTGYIITNAMPYMYVEFCFWDKANSRTTSWSNWWYDTHSNPDWFWTIYYWWRTYTRQYYSWYYYQPWWYIWHWLYWKHWNLWSTQA